MFNPLLDRLPEDYKGWLIRSDFRIGVQIQLCLSDPDLSEWDRTAAALGLLYGKGLPPDLKTALEGLGWFMACGAPQRAESGQGEAELYSFEYDAPRLVSAFKRVFQLDLSRARLHWFEFVPMLGDLSGTAFSSVLDIRQTRPGEIDPKRRAEFIRMKKRFALPSQLSREEEAALSDILERVKSESRL